jgi:hypothetical protein
MPSIPIEQLILYIIEALPAESAAAIADNINFNYFDGYNEVEDGDVYYGVGRHRTYPGRFAPGQIIYVRSGPTVKGYLRWNYLPDHPTAEERFQKNDDRRDKELAGAISTIKRISTLLVRKMAQWEVVARYELKESHRRDLRRACRYAEFVSQVLNDIAEDLAA